MFSDNKPMIRRLKISAAQLATSKFCSTRFATYYSIISEDVLGAMVSDQPELVAEHIQSLLEWGIRAFVVSHGRFVQTPENLFKVLGDICGVSSDLYREAYALARENPESVEGVIDLAKRCMDFVENGLGVDSIFPWWDSTWTPEQETRRWDSWGPAVLLADYLGINPLMMPLDSLLEVAREHEAQKRSSLATEP